MSNRQTNVLLVTVAIFIATFMSAIEGTIVSTAMPTIVGDLQGVSLMNWVFSIFLLTNAIATPLYGKVADMLGRKRVFLFGLTVFVAGSVLSGLSTSMASLILWRAVQGIGAGSIMPISFTIIADIYPVEKRAKVMGFNGSAWGIASIVAPLLGGFIVDHLTWHWIFFINLPVGLLAFAMIAIFLKETRVPGKLVIDWLGSILLTIGLLALMYGFQVLGEATPNWAIFALCLIVAVLAMTVFIWHEKRTANPIIPLFLFSNRTFVTQNLVAAVVSGYLMGFEVYLPTWMQGLLGLPASMAGFVVTPSSILWIFGSFLAGRLIAEWSPRKIINFSLLFILIGSLAMALVPGNTAYWWFYPIAAISGVGFGITITTTTVTAQSEATPETIGVATSINTLGRTLGQTLMISVFGIVMNQSMARGVAQNGHVSMEMMNQLINPKTAVNLPNSLVPQLRDILYSGLHSIFIGGLALILIAYMVNAFDRRHKLED
ncbi:EmrB QacA subfamily drug resistance transporter [Secundilactobacillus kimchicus JCM 15530]|uniref:EmrB QacA subfamily drug resistance transporter n=1 Tax=Secundilactobacillus kimchicus JCM 15530 TaxID=1302272 RepID=A0A0R1HZV4_9LACO|nr:MDR family MFS transporter [Secundilactobacillus kimchicus]KRK49090.1 EmrB QacA subfamily drug resistance transporter [Secundilactobacillus kimchicus JCM 15530]